MKTTFRWMAMTLVAGGLICGHWSVAQDESVRKPPEQDRQRLEEMTRVRMFLTGLDSMSFVKREVPMVYRVLGLTAEQKVEVETVWGETTKAVRSVNADLRGLGREERMARMLSIRKDRDAARDKGIARIDAALTEAQQKKLATLRSMCEAFRAEQKALYEEMQEKMAALTAKKAEALKGVLSEEDYGKIIGASAQR